MNAQQLRNSILQEAIEGRLVPQDPNDEPASVLLERIREEKKRLVKEGKLKKKDLEEKPISEDEKPFDIPDSWEWVKLKYIITGTGAGKSPDCEKRPKSGKEWGVITTTAVQYCAFLPNDNKVLPVKYVINDEQVIKDKDLLITRAGPKNRTGIVCVVDKPCDNLILSDKTVRINYLRDYCIPHYLMYALNNTTIRGIIMSATVGMAESQVNISQSNIQNIVIPLPPLAEQKRIVAKIEELLPKVEEYGKAQEALDKLNKELPERLKKSILQEAISGRLVPQDPNDEPASVLLDKIRKEKAQLVKEGKLKKKDLIETPITDDEKPFDIPQTWEWVRLSTLTKIIHYGYTASAAPQGNSKLLRITDIQNDKVNWTTVPFCTIKEKDLDAYKLNNRDILIARTGGTVGKTYIVRELSCVSVFASYLIRAVPLNSVYEEFVKLFMGSPFYWSQLTDATTGTGQPNVNGQSLSRLIIPLPPLAEQKRIVAKIEELFAEIDKLKA